MKRLLPIVVLLMLAEPALAADANNYIVGTGSQAWVGDGNFWTLGHKPTALETAWIVRRASSKNNDVISCASVIIDANGNFGRDLASDGNLTIICSTEFRAKPSAANVNFDVFDTWKDARITIDAPTITWDAFCMSFFYVPDGNAATVVLKGHVVSNNGPFGLVEPEGPINLTVQGDVTVGGVGGSLGGGMGVGTPGECVITIDGNLIADANWTKGPVLVAPARTRIWIKGDVDMSDAAAADAPYPAVFQFSGGGDVRVDGNMILETEQIGGGIVAGTANFYGLSGTIRVAGTLSVPANTGLHATPGTPRPPAFTP